MWEDPLIKAGGKTYRVCYSIACAAAAFPAAESGIGGGDGSYKHIHTLTLDPLPLA